MGSLAALVLAAGQGTRMKSEIPKMLHPLAGRPMLSYPVDLARMLEAKPIVIVIGHGSDAVRAAFDSEDLTFVEQEPQLGTGHAVKTAAAALQDHDGELLILSGDVPLLQLETLRRMVNHHLAKRADITALVGHLDDPSSYGRILRDKQGHVVRILEARDATEAERSIREVNAGTYCAHPRVLFDVLETLDRDNAQREYYLTDVVAALAPHGVATSETLCTDDLLGVNDRIELAQVEKILQWRLRSHWMREGVTMPDPYTVHLESKVRIGRDTVLEPRVILKGDTRVGSHCRIGTGSVIEDAVLEDFVTIKPYSIVLQSHVSSGASVGPFAHLRPGSVIGAQARVGNFVEVKKTTMGERSKASHLTYLGDTEIGKEVNVGAGTITCNYDGVTKHKTILEDNVFIGSNTELVAPVHVGKGAMVGAGSTITKNVPCGALAVARSRQVNLPDRAPRRSHKRG